MTEQPEGSRHEEPDTAALRASLDAGYGVELDTDEIYALLDALDAALAERDIYYDAVVVYEYRSDPADRARARAAEALRDTHAADVTDLANKHARALDRAEAAEARIAAALDLCATTPTSPCDPHCRVTDIRRALTEGTDQ